MKDSSLLSREKFFEKNFQYAGNGGGGNGEGGNGKGGNRKGKIKEEERKKRIPDVLAKTLMKICRFDNIYPGRMICTDHKDMKNYNQQRLFNDSYMDFDRVYWGTYEDQRERLNQGLINFKIENFTENKNNQNLPYKNSLYKSNIRDYKIMQKYFTSANGYIINEPMDNEPDLEDIENLINVIATKMFEKSELPLYHQDKGKIVQNYQNKNKGHVNDLKINKDISNYTSKTINEKDNNINVNNKLNKEVKNYKESENKYVNYKEKIIPKSSNMNINYRHQKIYDV